MKSKFAVAAFAALVTATAAHATSSITVSISTPIVSATGAFAWLDFGYGLGAAVEDQTGWLNGSTPTFSSQVLNYDYGLGAVTTTAAGNTASATASPSGYNFFVATGATGGIAVANLDIYGIFSLAPGATMTLQWNRTIAGSNGGQPNASDAYSFNNSLVVNTSGIIAGEWTGFPPVYATGDASEPLGFSIADSGLQTVSYTNSSDTLLIGEFRGSVQVYSRDAVALVPEPAHYALMLAGLATVGFMARRKRKA
jgi:hypothetical protein